MEVKLRMESSKISRKPYTFLQRNGVADKSKREREPDVTGIKKKKKEKRTNDALADLQA